MSVVTSPSRPIEVAGAAEIGFVQLDGTTRLKHLYQTDPLRVLFPNSPAGDLPMAVITSTAGGLVGGDRLDIRFHVGPQAQAMTTVQAAEKVYRSSGPDSRIDVLLQADEGAWLEWLPQETIQFDQARLRRTTRIDRQPGARVLAGEMLVLGRLAGGERYSEGLLHDAWEVRCDGKLAWTDALHLERQITEVINSPAGFNGCHACATLVFAADDAADSLKLARALIPPEGSLRVGATCLDGLLLVRWLGRDPLELRNHYGRFWAKFRQQVAGLPDSLPRLWHV